MRRLRFAVAALVLTIAGAAQAQQQSSVPIDPRIAGPMTHALQAELALRDAALRAMQEDAATREQQWKEWVKSWCGAAEGCAPVKEGSQ